MGCRSHLGDTVHYCRCRPHSNVRGSTDRYTTDHARLLASRTRSTEAYGACSRVASQGSTTSGSGRQALGTGLAMNARSDVRATREWMEENCPLSWEES